MTSLYKTRVNQPERVFLNSSDDPNWANTQGFSQFTCTYDTPILDARRTQLLRATIPNAQTNVPDYQLVFWYYKLPNAAAQPSAIYLQAVRLYPTWYVAPAALGTAYTKNRYFSDPADFVTQLNAAAAAGGDNVAYNPFWSAGDITFAYNATTKQITFTGNTATYYYCAAGYNDPNVRTAIAGGTITMPNYTGGGTSPQPLVPFWTLNLRVGYAFSGQSFDIQQGGGTSGAFANLTNTSFPQGTAVPADTFPNLVYTQCVYLYANVVAGSSLGSGKQHNLLSVIPSNAPQLGVIQYVATTINWLTKVPDNIYEITVEMRDDANQPFLLPDSAQVNIEMGFYYKDE